MELSTDAADIYRAFSRSLLSTAFRKLLGWLPLDSTPESANKLVMFYFGNIHFVVPQSVIWRKHDCAVLQFAYQLKL